MSEVKISQLPTATDITLSSEIAMNNNGVTEKGTWEAVLEETGVTPHIEDATKHRQINDAGTGPTDLWSAQKIEAAKANTSHGHNMSDLTGVLPVSKGGTGLNVIDATKLVYSPTANTLAALTPGTSLNINAGVLDTVDNTSNQKVIVAKDGTNIGTRKRINFITGANTSLSASDNSGSDQVDLTIGWSVPPLPTGYRGSAPPVYASSSTFTLAYLRDRNTLDTVDIAKPASTTVNIATTGLNGIAQSANLTGTMSVSASSTAITFSTSQTGVIQAGDVVTTAGGQSRVIASGSGTSYIAETNFTSTESTVTFKRGGRAASSWLNLYAIAKTDGTVPGTILDARNVAAGDTLLDLPSGYTIFKQLPFALRLDASGNIVPFKVLLTMYGTLVLWNLDASYVNSGGSTTIGSLNILNAGNATSFTPISVKKFVPPISQAALMQYTDSAGSFQVRPTGQTHTGIGIWAPTSTVTMGQVISLVNASQSFDYVRVLGGSGTLTLDVLGYFVTEVA